MSEQTSIIRRISGENSSGFGQIVGWYISNYFGHKILTILHQNSDNIFKKYHYVSLKKNVREKGNVGPRLFI